MPCEENNRLTRNIRREVKAYALIAVMMDWAPADRLRFLDAALQGLSAGMPIPAFGQIMREANFRADMAIRAGQKAYCAAAPAHMPPEDQDVFRTFISQERAAA